MRISCDRGIILVFSESVHLHIAHFFRTVCHFDGFNILRKFFTFFVPFSMAKVNIRGLIAHIFAAYFVLRSAHTYSKNCRTNPTCVLCESTEERHTGLVYREMCLFTRQLLLILICQSPRDGQAESTCVVD